MTRSEMFAVLIKAMGLWVLITGLEAVLAVLPVFASARMSNMHAAVGVGLAITLGWKIVLGCSLFFGANRIASWIYRNTTPAENPSQS